MPRISEIEEDGGDPTLKSIFDRERETFGGLLNPTKVQAHCPPIMRAAKPLASINAPASMKNGTASSTKLPIPD